MLLDRHKSRSGAVIASSALAALSLAACSSSSSTSSATASASASSTASTSSSATSASATTTDTSSSSATSSAGGAIKKGLKVYFIPKDTNNPYEVIADEGGADALKELGGEVIVSSGTEDTAAAQLPSIQAAIAAKADAIVIAGNDPDALCPALGQAQAAGIEVVAFDSDVTCPDHLFINQADTESIGRSEVQLLAKQIGSKGEIAILSAAATATNQNAWIDYMKKELVNFPDMKLVDTVYGNDDPATSLTVLQGLLTKHPNLRGIISPTTVGISTAAQYLQKHTELKGKVTLTGLGLPSQMKPYVLDGTVESFELWNPRDLGYLAGYAAAALASGVVELKEGATFTAGKLKDYTLAKSGTEFTIVLGPPQVFDKSNVADFNF
ncbi:MAG: rhamnose transporter, periplasmic rhamnose-binding protein [Frankiales bacterium]|nr:rhamnose transporter, periplasmic rhamnose-binding protein [Frankiales bacterium]